MFGESYGREVAEASPFYVMWLPRVPASIFFAASSKTTTFPLTQFSRTTTLQRIELLPFCDSKRRAISGVYHGLPDPLILTPLKNVWDEMHRPLNRRYQVAASLEQLEKWVTEE